MITALLAFHDVLLYIIGSIMPKSNFRSVIDNLENKYYPFGILLYGVFFLTILKQKITKDSILILLLFCEPDMDSLGPFVPFAPFDFTGNVRV